MKRPLALFCVSIITGITAAAFIGGSLGIAACATVTAAAVCWIFSKRRGFKIAAVALLGLALAFLVANSRYEQDVRLAEYSGSEQQIKFTVTSASETTWHNYRITARGSLKGERIELWFYSDEQLIPGTDCVAVAALSEYDFFAHAFEAENIDVYHFQTSSMITSIRRVRLLASGVVKSALGSAEGEVAAGIAFGDKGGISAEITHAFRNSGASHLLVVSGLHISILLHLVTSALKRLRAPYPFILATIVLCCLSVLIMMDFSVSALRVSVMNFMVYGAGVLRRRSDSATSLATAGALILLVDASAVGDAGFWLSFSATFALTVIYPAMIAKLPKGYYALPKMLRPVLSTVIGSFAASVAILPALIAFEMDISIISPITNAAVIWLMPLTLILCILSALLFLLAPSGAVSLAVFWVARLIVGTIMRVSSALGSIPGAACDSTVLPVRLAALAVIAGLALWLLLKGRAAKIGLCGSAAVLILSVALLAVYRNIPGISIYNHRGELSVVAQQNNECCVFVANPSRGLAWELNQIGRTHGYSYDYAFVLSGSESAESDFAEAFNCEDIITRGDMDVVVQQFGPMLIQTLGSSEFVTYADQNGCEYAVWEIEGSRVCFCLSANPLPRELIDCDIIVVCRQMPENISDATGYIIFAGSSGVRAYKQLNLNYLFGEWR